MTLDNYEKKKPYQTKTETDFNPLTTPTRTSSFKTAVKPNWLIFAEEGDLYIVFYMLTL